MWPSWWDLSWCLFLSVACRFRDGWHVVGLFSYVFHSQHCAWHRGGPRLNLLEKEKRKWIYLLQELLHDSQGIPVLKSYNFKWSFTSGLPRMTWVLCTFPMRNPISLPLTSSLQSLELRKLSCPGSSSNWCKNKAKYVITCIFSKSSNSLWYWLTYIMPQHGDEKGRGRSQIEEPSY